MHTQFKFVLFRVQAGFGNHTKAFLRAQKFHGLEQTGTANVTLEFPLSMALEEWGPHTFLMVTDGSIMPTKDGGLLMLLYGNLLADGKATSKYSILAMKSVTGGMSWTYLSTVARGASKGCGAPSEHDCVRLSNQGIYCVWRVADEGSLCSAVSHDEGATWSAPAPLRPPKATALPGNTFVGHAGLSSPPITPNCSRVLDSYCNNRTANKNCIDATESWYGPATLPMFGLFDKSCAHPTCKGHNCTCAGPGPEAWRCYSELSLNATHNGWSNEAPHPNAYCSECGCGHNSPI